MFLVGPTGAGKSELAALLQQHWGRQLDSRHLPGSWSSTANSLEGLAFLAKDSLIVVDDFVPSGKRIDADRLHREAERILRAQGNSSGRQRMRPDSSLRAPRPPRGLILSTGEGMPNGHSLRARSLILELSHESVEWNALTECQKHARAGTYSMALAGFVHWVAGRYEKVNDRLPEYVSSVRPMVGVADEHKRSVCIHSDLLAGMSCFIAFAKSVGALTKAEGRDLMDRTRRALESAFERQASHQAAGDPVSRFLEMMRAAITSGKAHVTDRQGKAPSDARACGWKMHSDASTTGTWQPCGQRVGWVDGDDLYLLPLVSYEVATRLAEVTGESIALSERTLKKRLAESGKLCTTGQSRGTTIRKVLEGARREVLHLRKSDLIPPGDKL